MADKLNEYQGVTGRLHGARDKYKERWARWKEQHPRGVKDVVAESLFGIPNSENSRVWQDSTYSDLFRRKSRIELMRISAAVMGIEFSYAGETAFVSPTLLQIGVPHQQMTLVWALSPLIGFFMTPLLGSLSDRCKSRFGRRRPFIVMMSMGVLLGLILVPNGESIGYALGDSFPLNRTETPSALGPRSSLLEAESPNYHPWGVFFTVLGTVFLDFDADACQSPARAYLLDVTVPEDHAKGLSTFTVMAGLGGFMGYALGGINWDDTTLGDFFGGHVRAVFSLITVIFVVCVSATVTSFKEIPLDELNEQDEFRKLAQNERIQESIDLADEADGVGLKSNASYGAVNQAEPAAVPIIPEEAPPSVAHYLKSIVMMPPSLRVVCLTNLFCWMAHVCYSLYFTDFVGESVFGGDPAAPVGSALRRDYEEGVRFGCWGMAMYSLSCACYSTVIEKLIKKFGAKKVYVGGLCTYSLGMFMLCAARAPAAVLLFSWTAGVMYSTLFTLPYLLVAHYHATGTWDEAGNGCGSARGIGTDVAVVSSCVFVAQLLVSLIMGVAVKAVGSTAAVVAVAAAFAAAAAFTATRITYLDLYEQRQLKSIEDKITTTTSTADMEALGAFFRKLTPTRALVLSSGKFETLFFETVYRLTYITGLSTIEKGWGYFVYSSAVKFMLLLLSFGEAAICFDANLSVDERVGCINVCLLQYISIYRYKNKIDNKEAYKELAVSMESALFDTTTPERRMLVDFWARTNSVYLKLLFVWGNLTLIAWYIYPLIDDIEYNLSIRIYIPFSFDNQTRYPLVYFAVVVMFGYMALFVMINDMTIQAHLMHLICRLTVLGDCFKNLLEDCQVGFEGIHSNYLIYNKEFADKYMRRMGILVEQHSIILRQILNLRNTLSRAMLFQFMASGTLICFVGFETIMTLTENTAKTVNSLFFLGYNIFELYIICRWCDEITVQSQNIGESIYACGWESGTSVLPGIKQSVKLVIARANKPLYFTAGGMYSLSLASFSTLVKTSYSTLTVVLRMSHK